LLNSQGHVKGSITKCIEGVFASEEYLDYKEIIRSDYKKLFEENRALKEFIKKTKSD
jgi:hypothetical protein